MSLGDVTSNERGSGARYNDGKVPLDLIPLSALKDCARVFGYGRNKYAAWNWAKGMQWSAPYGCLLRHLSAWFDGEDNDPESGLPHLGHAMCNLVMLSTFARTYREGDDRPVRWLGLTASEALDRVSMAPPDELPPNLRDAMLRVPGIGDLLKDTEQPPRFVPRDPNAPAETGQQSVVSRISAARAGLRIALRHLDKAREELGLAECATDCDAVRHPMAAEADRLTEPGDMP